VRAFWLLVLAPLAVAGYLAVRVSSDGDEQRQRELNNLLDGRLADVRTRASQATAAIESDLVERLAAAPTAAEDLRALGRTIPLERQVFRGSRDGKLVFPIANADASAAEREFLERTQAIWAGRAILPSAVDVDDRSVVHSAGTIHGFGDRLVDLAAANDHGWLSWYWAEGLHLLFWRRAADGGVIGVELERVGVLSRVVGALPTTALDGRMELADSRGDTVHQWGPMIAPEGAPPARADASLALAAPLDSWRLRYFISPAQRSALVATHHAGLWIGLGALALALVGLAFVVYREYTRRLRDAARRVSFVTRVSHELRTPLTNIRMYAELVEDATADDDQLRRVRVIVAETQRLGRLIDNVLAFARHQRGTLAVRPDRVDVDDAVREAVAKFEPALASREIAIELDLDNPPAARADTDTVDQIVTNLLSNVEKYAAGGQVTISTRTLDDRVVIGVADHGPGVAPDSRDKIFEPFHRVSDSLTEGANGTGIGLAIARELARAAGGDLVLAADTGHGARFELTLPVARGDDR
jgi:signal transduction histidine kinase